VHGLAALFLEVIMHAIILLFVGLAALRVLIVVVRTTAASIVLMMIVRSAVIVIASVTLMIVAILVATMLLVAQFMAMRSRKMSHFVFFWLLFILSNLLENASCYVGCLTLHKESDDFEQVSGHLLVQVCDIELMRLGLRKEDLFTLLVCHGYFHRLMEVATLEIAKELYSTLHDLVHQHESELLGSTTPANQLVANIGEPCNGLKVILDAFEKVCLCTIYFIGALLRDDIGPFGQAYVLKTLTYQVKQHWIIVLLSI
jgi:hypothetical protein